MTQHSIDITIQRTRWIETVLIRLILTNFVCFLTPQKPTNQTIKTSQLYFAKRVFILFYLFSFHRVFDVVNNVLSCLFLFVFLLSSCFVRVTKWCGESGNTII